MNRRTFLGGCTAAALLLAGCSGVGGPVESGSLDGEQVTHEIDVQAGETVRIEVEGGSLTVARVLGHGRRSPARRKVVFRAAVESGKAVRGQRLYPAPAR